VIVSDAGPLIVLLKTNNLSILQRLFIKIVVPKTVYQEITAKKQEKQFFDNINWIEIKSAKNTELNALIEQLVDKGEAEAIVLAKELKSCLLVDDAKARKYAKMLNVEVIGTLGLLKMAKNRGVSLL
jgi:predicted nucleic acid-binding protein